MTFIINGKDVSDYTLYDFDGCHKFYLYKNEKQARDDLSYYHEDKKLVEEIVRDLKPISELPNNFFNSCPLRFIDKIENGDIKSVVEQGATKVKFELGTEIWLVDFEENDISKIA